MSDERTRAAESAGWEHFADAPGRVNLIGEHTDYNGGFVLPIALAQRTRVRLRKRADRAVHGFSRSVPAESSRFVYELGQERRSGQWWDYVQGVTSALAAARAADLAPGAIAGFDIEIDSDVPLGSGLSSSAALEVALLRALRAAYRLDLSDTRIAQIAQKAETDFVGARIGIMDQMASSLSDASAALFLDARSLQHRRVALPKAAELAIVNSGISHRHDGGDYNKRRAECEDACARLGVRELREVELGDLAGEAFAAMPETLRRRVRHIVTENARVLSAVRAMEAGDADALGRLFSESHLSMRDDYEMSIPEIDVLVEIADAHPEVYGARLTGGGFGGSIVILAHQGSARAVAESVAQEYGARTGQRPQIMAPAGLDAARG